MSENHPTYDVKTDVNDEQSKFRNNKLKRLEQQPGWMPWMTQWVDVDVNIHAPAGTIYYGFHPDNSCFLVTSDPEELINGFTKFPYNG